MRVLLIVAATATLAALVLDTRAAARSKGAEARLVMKRFAACTVHREPEIARRFVLSRLDERLPERDFRKLVSSSCLREAGAFVARLSMRSGLFRGALAEELVRAGKPDVATGDLSTVPPLAWGDPVAPANIDGEGRPIGAKARRELETSYRQAIGDVFVARLGECVVRADQAGSKAVLLSSLDSAQELAAMKLLSGVIASCVARGETLRFNRTTLRAGLALSYYRLVAAREAQPQGAVR